jgi:predicted dehydrogenase
MARLALGLIGAGRLAEAGYLPAAALTKRVLFAAVADPDEGRRALVSGGRLIEYPSAHELVAAGGLDGVVVASPPATHEEFARLAAIAGLPALVEKPPAPDLAGARRIADLDPAPSIAFNRRFSLGAGLQSTLPDSGTIELEIRYRRFSWSPVMVRDPALLDLAPHVVDLALRSGLGTPVSVAATSSRPERVEIAIEGASGSARIRCATDRPHLERVVVRDAAGSVVGDARTGGLVRGAIARLRPAPHPLVASLAAQLDEFAAACAGEPAPTLATASDGVAVMEVIAAAAESLAHDGAPVALPARGITA